MMNTGTGGRSRSSSGKDFKRAKRNNSHLHNNSTSSESSVSVRSSQSEISVNDMISFLKDVQKFLDRLNHEQLSADCLEIKYSLSNRIEFYTKKNRADWLQTNSNDRDSFDLPPPPPAFLETENSTRLSFPPPLPTSLPPSLLEGPPPVPVRRPKKNSMSMSLDTSSAEESFNNYDDKSSTNEFDTYSDSVDNRYSQKGSIASLDLYAAESDSEDYDKIHQSPARQVLIAPGTPPTKTSTPKSKRNSGMSLKFENIPETNENLPEPIEEDEYDIVENMAGHASIPDVDFAGTSARILNSLADHKGWLWKKESIFKTPRFWALVYQSKLYLYLDATDEMAKECYNLEDASLKRHKKGIKFIVNVNGTYKNKNAKQEYQTENSEQTEIWIQSLENAIATAGKVLTAIKKTSTESQDSKTSFSLSTQEDPEEDEEYDTVEVLRSSILIKSQFRPEQFEEDDDIEPNDHQTYDVPKPKNARNSSASNLGVKTRSTTSLNKTTRSGSSSRFSTYCDSTYFDENIEASQDAPSKLQSQASINTQEQDSFDSSSDEEPQAPVLLQPERRPVPPLPSPRKISLGPQSLTITPQKAQPPLPKSKPPGVRKLFSDDEQNESKVIPTKSSSDSVSISKDFSSKTLRPKKSVKESTDSENKFRPRNKSESKKPETMQNELALILEKRRQNLTKPVIPERPKNLTIDAKDNFPPYSKVNKAAKQPKFETLLKTPESPNRSFKAQAEYKSDHGPGW
eukprot:GFUD01009201.1.p1 GENE.GFUD01009201.1~~GFUD01009201.1.p1  ORF type:complete len:742 (+),score=148.30 GFUD01009201.1:295-2520(+)